MKEQTLRVCHLGKYYPPAPGGIETHVRTLARAQAAMGAQVRVVCINHLDRHGRDMTWSRYGATETAEESDGPVRVTRVGRSASFARLDLCPDLRGILRELSSGESDVLHLHAPNPTMLLALAVVRPGTPLIITHHSDVIRQRVLRHVFRPFENLVYRQAVQICATSPAYTSGSALLQRHEDRVSALPLGVDLGAYLDPSAAALRHAGELRHQYGTPIWLMVGRCVYYKGLDTAIRALAHTPGTLMIIGTGPLEHALHNLARQEGVADRVIWKRYATHDELIAAYHASTALWFPSNARSEAFGLVQVEAMASGCPVINTNIPGSGVAWVSPHMQTGITVPINDPVALAKAARALASDSALRSRLSTAARVRSRSEFDHMTMAGRSLAGYRSALTGEPIRQTEAAGKSMKLRPLSELSPALDGLTDDDMLEFAR